MKKLRLLMMSVLVASALAACGTNNDTNDKADDNQATENEGMKDNESTQDSNQNDDTNGVDNGVDHNGESRLDVAEDAADKVAELDEVDNAMVILTDNNAYVAVEMKNADNANGEEELSKDLEDKIADKVRETQSDLNHVYVSLNPDFVERMRDYRTRVNEGEPIEGLFDEFGETMRNIFPDAR